MTVRFLDPPLHEFVPTEEADIEQLAKDMGKSVQDIKNIIASLHEFNPMMGTVAAVWPLRSPRSLPCRPARSSRLR